MPTLHKKSCPTCGQSVNERQVTMFSGMVDALWAVYRWCRANDRHEFARKEIKHLFKNENQIARFGDWVFFGGLVYRPDGKGKGHFGLNLGRCTEFFAGEYRIPDIVTKDPLTGKITHTGLVRAGEIKPLTQLLDYNQEYIAEYGQPRQKPLL